MSLFDIVTHCKVLMPLTKLSQDFDFEVDPRDIWEISIVSVKLKIFDTFVNRKIVIFFSYKFFMFCILGTCL
jgi:hypothetical protein